ncbi:CysQ protein [Afipia sp. P52-10]|uniref:3'(2'),5'-bisphosphate nucleotidase CysQ n=1 Tax=Afipia sp. P52-10 TaxID=1429916 RepID=UPI0003DF281B|nr:3'(2'),5'-bisphosphate nucleotidase CysQ [Afipia sp. P52-10]ETR76766.1 CysQ protein [Afipia sp. P52-10]
MTPPVPTQPIIDQTMAPSLLEPLTDLVVAASAAILEVARREVSAESKQDGSPVTEADLAADRIIVDGLTRLMPAVPVVSEERVDRSTGPYLASFFIVDPLDGTREFIAGHDDYTVNVALVTNGRPLLGVISAPALGLLWRGVVGSGAERMELSADPAKRAASLATIRPRPWPRGPWLAAVSRSHGDPRTDAFIDSRGGAGRVPIGSALKFCRVAEGAVDIYPRLSAISEWDIAAGHAILEAAGGVVTDSRGQPIRFGQRKGEFAVPEFIAWGDAAQAR